MSGTEHEYFPEAMILVTERAAKILHGQGAFRDRITDKELLEAAFLVIADFCEARDDRYIEACDE